MKKTIWLGLALCLLCPAIGFSDPTASFPGWDRVTVIDQPLLGNRRDQIADVGWGSARRFAVAYIVSPPDQSAASPATEDDSGLFIPLNEPAPEEFEKSGPFFVSHYNIDRNLKSAPIRIDSVDVAAWVRAATGGPIITPTCPLVVQPAAFSAGLQTTAPVGAAFNNESSAYFAYGARLVNALEVTVNVMRVRWCNGTRIEQFPLEPGYRPSIAIGRRDGEQRLFVVYGNENRLMGLFLTPNGERIGVPFTITTFNPDEGLVSTDVIWNPAGDRFIVGYMQFAGGVSATPENCAVRNVRVTWDGTSDSPLLHGTCDPERGGHHTSVDIDLRESTNSNGTYAWWYEGLDGKGVRIMDSSGQPISILSKPSQRAWTIPVTARHEEDRRGRIRRFLSNLFGNRPDSYVVSGRASLSNDADHRLSAWTVNRNSSVTLFGLITSTLASSDPIAIEALNSESVVLWRCCGSDDDSGHGEWGLSVFKHLVPSPGFALDP